MAYTLGGVTIRNPDAGWSAGYERIGGTHQLLGGGRVQDTVAMKRSFGFSWTHLTTAEYTAIEGRFLTALPMTLVMDDGKTATVLFQSLTPTRRLPGLVDATASLIEA